MPKCVVRGCINNSTANKKQDGVTFHTFPIRNEDAKEKWIEVIRVTRNEPFWNPTVHSVVCSKHFENDDLYCTRKGLRRVLLSGYPKHLPSPHQSVHASERTAIKVQRLMYTQSILPATTRRSALGLPRTRRTRDLLRIVAKKQSTAASANIPDALQKRDSPNNTRNALLNWTRRALFPRNNNRKDEWVQIIQNCRGENDWNPSSSSTICSAHFDDVDFITTVKGLRCLVPYAIPKRLLSNLPETQTQSSSSPIMQISPNVEGVVNDQQLLSTPSMASCLLQVPSIKEEIAPNEGVVDDQVSLSPISDPLQVPLIKVEFVLTGYCRLCAATPCDGNLVNIQSDDVLKQLVVNMSNRLNTKIDFSQQHLPTTICPVCVKQLYTAYDFVVGIDLAQTNLNEISIQKYKYQMPVNSILGNNMDLSNISLQQLSTNTGAATPPQSVELSTTPFLLDTPRERHLKHCLDKKKRIIEIQKKKLKTLNQKIRRLQNRNDSLKDILKIN